MPRKPYEIEEENDEQPRKRAFPLWGIAAIATVVICFGSVVVIMVVGAISQRHEEAKARSDDDILIANAEKLHNRFEANEVAADKDFKGKRFGVTGTIVAIRSSSPFQGPVVTLGEFVGFAPFRHVDCEFPKGSETAVSKLQQGQNVTIIGTCTGKFAIVGFEKCSLR